MKCCTAWALTNITAEQGGNRSQADTSSTASGKATMSIKGRACASTPCARKACTQACAAPCGRVTHTRGEGAVALVMQRGSVRTALTQNLGHLHTQLLG